MSRDRFGRSVALTFGEHCAAARDEAIAAGGDARVCCRCGNVWHGNGDLTLAVSARRAK